MKSLPCDLFDLQKQQFHMIQLSNIEWIGGVGLV